MGPRRAVALNWDAIGIGASTLCMVHCLLTPLLLAFAPACAHFLPGSETVHRTLAYLLMALGLLAFRAGYRIHHKKSILTLLAAGMAGVTVGAYANLPSHGWEVGITFLGGSLLILAHYCNRRLCHLIRCQDCHTCEDCQS